MKFCSILIPHTIYTIYLLFLALEWGRNHFTDNHFADNDFTEKLKRSKN